MPGLLGPGPYIWCFMASLGGIHGGSSRAGSLYSPSRRSSECVTVTKAQLQNISDSLRRARGAAEAAETLCTKAARAFAEESNTIDECKQVADSYVGD